LPPNDTTSTSVNYKAGTFNLTPSAASGSGVANYTISYTTDTNGLAVAQKALTVSGISGTNQTYKRHHGRWAQRHGGAVGQDHQ